MSKLSVVIIAKDEEMNLPRCLESVKWADEIVLIDHHSTDKTATIAHEYGAKVISQDWCGFGPAKQRGVDLADSEWILSIDADEVISPELADEIREVVRCSDNVDGYYIPRRTQFLGRWIYHCGWYPDPVLRLFRKTKGSFTTAVVHEQVVVDGKVGRLKRDLLHYSYPSLDVYLTKFNRYTTLAAREAFDRRKHASILEIVFRPLACFIKHYLLKAGFLDGFEGFLVSILSSGYVLVKYAKLRDLRRKSDHMEPPVK